MSLTRRPRPPASCLQRDTAGPRTEADHGGCRAWVICALMEMLGLNRSPAEALSAGHVTTALAPRVQLEADTPRAAMADALRARGHEVVVEPTVSGAGFIKRMPGGLIGAADPRRDGVALWR